MTDQTIACDGCGETDPAKRCIGCLHDFGDPSSLWVRLRTPVPTLRDDPMSDAAVEAVARAFCKRMGLDPDESVMLVIDARKPNGPMWRRYERKAKEAIAMHLALKEVLG